MPVWMAAALRLLAGTPTRAFLTGSVAGTAGGLIPSFRGDGEDPLMEKKRRRRRRRALTASDRADIAFIAGLLGTTAGKNFALTIATRT